MANGRIWEELSLMTEGSRLRLPGTIHDGTTAADVWLDSSMCAGLFPGVASNAPPTAGCSHQTKNPSRRRGTGLI
jgi:hypothetical protein